MKFSVPVEQFHPAFAAALAAAARKSTKPVLMHVKCTANDDGTLILQGTNNEVGVVARVTGATVERAGDVVLQGTKLLDILKLSRGDTLSVQSSETKVEVATSRSKHQLAVIPPDQFPDIEQLAAATLPVAEVPADSLVKIIRRAGFAAADELEDPNVDTRGVLIHCGENRVRLVSFQRIMASMAWDSRAKSLTQGSATVHPSTLRLLSSILPDDDSPVEVRMSPGGFCTSVAFSTPAGMLWSRTMESKGSTDHLDRVFPTVDHQPIAAWSDAKPLFRAAEEACVSTDKLSRRIQLAIQPTGGMASAKGGEGESDVDFDVPEFAGGPASIAIDSLSLNVVRRALAKEKVKVGCQVYEVGKYLRMVFRFGEQDSGGVAVLMQMPNDERT